MANPETTNSKRAIAALLIISFIIPLVFLTHPRQTEAQLAVAESGPMGFVVTAIKVADVATATGIEALVTKAYVLDAITWAAKAVIHGMSTSIINWINSGFQGNPTFVTDLGAFLIDVADQELGTFLEESGDFSFLCSPFSFPVQLQLLIDYYRPYRDRATCTLTGIAGNVERFIQGDFREMGWQGWFDVSTRQRNNPFGSLILAQTELNTRIAWAQRIQQKILDFGKGFFSDCRDDSGETQTTGFPCDIVTPGVVIEDALVEQLGTGLRQLEIADEINEIVAALIAQLMQEALTGTGGLRGLSSRGGGSVSYLDRLTLEGSSTVDLDTNKNALISVIDTNVGRENEYQNSKQQILDELNIAESKYDSVIACYQNKIAGGTLTSSETATANSRIDSAAATLNNSITPKEATTTEAIRVSDLNIAWLDRLRENALFARTDEELTVVSIDYAELLGEGVLHFGADTEDRELLGEAQSFTSDGSSKLTECNAFPPPPPTTGGGSTCVPTPLAPC